MGTPPGIPFVDQQGTPLRDPIKGPPLRDPIGVPPSVSPLQRHLGTPLGYPSWGPLANHPEVPLWEPCMEHPGGTPRGAPSGDQPRGSPLGYQTRGTTSRDYLGKPSRHPLWDLLLGIPSRGTPSCWSSCGTPCGFPLGDLLVDHPVGPPRGPFKGKPSVGSPGGPPWRTTLADPLWEPHLGHRPLWTPLWTAFWTSR